jgi:hypothetical protein
LALRKEHVVLIGTIAVLGFCYWRTMGSYEVKAGRIPKAAAPVLERHPAPDTALVLPSGRQLDASRRDLFSPPSDTRPLPPLELVPPPIVALAQLRPPPVPGPGVGLYGKFLRESPTVVDVPDLFVDADDVSDAPGAAAAPAKDVKPTAGAAVTPEQIAARIKSHKKLYDWIRIGDFRFGQIRNPERYTLAKRANEDILFVEFNPETGQPKFPGQPPAPVPRKTVSEFDFADTIPNQIEIRRAQLGNPLPASEYDLALAFADWCVDIRLETPRALVVAEEIYRRPRACCPRIRRRVSVWRACTSLVPVREGLRRVRRAASRQLEGQSAGAGEPGAVVRAPPDDGQRGRDPARSGTCRPHHVAGAGNVGGVPPPSRPRRGGSRALEARTGKRTARSGSEARAHAAAHHVRFGAARVR